MAAFDAELADCIEEIVAERFPPAGDDALLAARQWLGGRNLGLVPIADVATFQRPGKWLARVRVAGDEHAVVMFGAAPSGPLRPGSP